MDARGTGHGELCLRESGTTAEKPEIFRQRPPGSADAPLSIPFLGFIAGGMPSAPFEKTSFIIRGIIAMTVRVSEANPNVLGRAIMPECWSAFVSPQAMRVTFPL
jgi:hypothetical protein